MNDSTRIVRLLWDRHRLRGHIGFCNDGPTLCIPTAPNVSLVGLIPIDRNLDEAFVDFLASEFRKGCRDGNTAGQ